MKRTSPSIEAEILKFDPAETAYPRLADAAPEFPSPAEYIENLLRRNPDISEVDPEKLIVLEEGPDTDLHHFPITSHQVAMVIYLISEKLPEGETFLPIDDSYWSEDPVGPEELEEYNRMVGHHAPPDFASNIIPFDSSELPKPEEVN